MMFDLDPNRRHYTPDQYLEKEKVADYKSEYYHGEIFAMVGSTDAHSTIAVNIAASFVTQLRGRPCRAYSNDTKIAPDLNNSYFYPDLSIACGEPDFRDEKRTILLNPKLIVEILSPSTEEFDREEKFASYAQIASLTDYILISQHKPWIEHFSREAQGKWVYQTATDITGVLEIASISCQLALSDVYDRIAFRAETLSRLQA